MALDCYSSFTVIIEGIIGVFLLLGLVTRSFGWCRFNTTRRGALSGRVDQSVSEAGFVDDDEGRRIWRSGRDGSMSELNLLDGDAGATPKGLAEVPKKVTAGRQLRFEGRAGDGVWDIMNA